MEKARYNHYKFLIIIIILTRITSVKLGCYFTSNLWTSMSCALMTPSVIRNAQIFD